jgi:hypothetical protein
MRPSLATFWLFLGYLKLSLGAPSLLVRGKRRASGVKKHRWGDESASLP